MSNEKEELIRKIAELEEEVRKKRAEEAAQEEKLEREFPGPNKKPTVKEGLSFREVAADLPKGSKYLGAWKNGIQVSGPGWTGEQVKEALRKADQAKK